MSVQNNIFWIVIKKHYLCNEKKTSLSNKSEVNCLSLICFQSNMGHRKSHKWSTYHFVAQKVTLTTQLKINVFKGYKESPSYTTEVKKLPFMQKCSSWFLAINLWKENYICIVWSIICFGYIIEDERSQFSII